jgi:hypothetical protein
MVTCDPTLGLYAALRRHAERCEEESEAFIDPTLLPTLEGLLQDAYTSLQPEPVDYEHRQVMIGVFNKIAEQIFGKRCFVCYHGSNFCVILDRALAKKKYVHSETWTVTV